MTFEPGQVVRVPFPFTDRAARKHRPALVLSAAEFTAASGHALLAMITSAKNPPWLLDCAIGDLAAAGLPAPSVVRMKLFTLDNRLIRGVLGRLTPKDAEHVRQALRQMLAPAL
ncbi:type II toxin-antitoxin system PemK/MazF family toxin [Pelomicrobium methylotrophicum]|uniref:Type II toxin-antitoxin system PemK/MazF family toxin n=1 Tax=Pelomicrobium methylotrophicum TaxID=2602750 RepID=A0A5C7ESR8_9PROT|nr:type II toxin-antitoxin system PemK/MazF family toxin [Pelomicrobium methylotrophicum]TXF09823.1 type II toxin-antitoxin system PemK/MazF family toxin [Pelomicrobium methylotrophicum]